MALYLIYSRVNSVNDVPLVKLKTRFIGEKKFKNFSEDTC